MGKLDPLRDNNEGTYRGGKRDETCDDGFVQKVAEGETSLRVELGGSKSDESYLVAFFPRVC